MLKEWMLKEWMLKVECLVLNVEGVNVWCLEGVANMPSDQPYRVSFERHCKGSDKIIFLLGRCPNCWFCEWFFEQFLRLVQTLWLHRCIPSWRAWCLIAYWLLDGWACSALQYWVELFVFLFSPLLDKLLLVCTFGGCCDVVLAVWAALQDVFAAYLTDVKLAVVLQFADETRYWGLEGDLHEVFV